MSLVVDRLMNRYLSRFPGAREVSRVDSMYHWQVRMLRNVLALTEMAMEDNCIPENVREQVLRETLYGSAPDVAAAEDRIAGFAEALQKAEQMAPRPWMTTAQRLDELYPDTPPGKAPS